MDATVKKTLGEKFEIRGFPTIFSGEVKSIMLLFVSASAEDYSAKVETARVIAKDHKGEMRFITVNIDEEEHKRIVDFFGIEISELPSMRILKRDDDMKKFKPESTELNEENIRLFVKQYLAGELKPHLMSEEVPEDWDKKTVKVSYLFIVKCQQNETCCRFWLGRISRRWSRMWKRTSLSSSTPRGVVTVSNLPQFGMNWEKNLRIRTRKCSLY